MLSSTMWAAQVAHAAQLPDRRLGYRFATILVAIQENPLASIPQASGGDAGQAKAMYRFYSNRRVTSSHLSVGFAKETAQRCFDQAVVLLVQDSTTLNFTRLSRISELGAIDSGGLARGLHLHTTLAVTLGGLVLGVLDQQCWARQTAQNQSDAKMEKESAKWINGLESARAMLHETAQDGPLPCLIHVMDREGDAYEVMMMIEESGDSAIIRSAQNRKVDAALGKAHDAVRSQPVLCRCDLIVKRKHAQPERQARVEVRSLAVTLQPDLSKYPHAWPMTWHLVEVWEAHPPEGAIPLHWLLWTREAASTAEEALEVVRKYTCRWPIEEMHLVLKSGCKIEDLRLETWERLEKAVRMNTSVAARIVSLRDLARDTPQAPALTVLQQDEVDVLVNHFGQGKPILATELTLAQAVLWIGRLGGHLNRKKDGMPGVRTLWRGLQALTLLVAGFRAGLRANQVSRE